MPSFFDSSARSLAGKSLATLEKLAKEKPLRHRVEVVATVGDHVLTGAFKGDGAHGFFGGGVDPGETPAEAAVRELAEESGFVGTNPRLLPVEPHREMYSGSFKGKQTDKMKARAKQYSGSVTHYVAVDVADKDAKPGTDHKHSFDPKTIGFRPVNEAAPLVAADDNPQRGKKRLAALMAATQKAAALLLPPLPAPTPPIKLPSSLAAMMAAAARDGARTKAEAIAAAQGLR